MKKYEKYKDSGIEWIGTIPEGWMHLKTKYLFDIVSGTTPDSSNEDYWDGDIPWITPADFKTEDHFVSAGRRYLTQKGYNSCGTTLVQQGSIIFSKRAPIGSVALASNELCTNQGCLSCVPKENVESRYYYYAMSLFTDVYNMLGDGTTFKEISATTFSSFELPFPPKDEQQAIASYLDHKVSQIDASVSAIDRQIEDLKAYRMSIISEAVTKGLNPDAPMKDSGIEWIGQIPEGWETILLKRVAVISVGSTPSTNIDKYWKDEDYIWYTPSDIKECSLYLGDSERKVSHVAAEEGALRIFPAMSALMVGIGNIGRIALTKKECSSNQQILSISFKNMVNPVFGTYFMQASRDYIQSKANSALLAIINQTTTGNLEFLLPPFYEQQAIASYLETKTKKIDATISSLKLQKVDLEALKQSIISEAVTGKIDLRNWKINNK